LDTLAPALAATQRLSPTSLLVAVAASPHVELGHPALTEGSRATLCYLL
jgi:hypothetical protein